MTFIKEITSTVKKSISVNSDMFQFLIKEQIKRIIALRDASDNPDDHNINLVRFEGGHNLQWISDRMGEHKILTGIYLDSDTLNVEVDDSDNTWDEPLSDHKDNLLALIHILEQLDCIRRVDDINSPEID